MSKKVKTLLFLSLGINILIFLGLFAPVPRYSDACADVFYSENCRDPKWYLDSSLFRKYKELSSNKGRSPDVLKGDIVIEAAGSIRKNSCEGFTVGGTCAAHVFISDSGQGFIVSSESNFYGSEKKYEGRHVRVKGKFTDRYSTDSISIDTAEIIK